MSPLAAARVSLTSEYATILRKLTEFLRNRSVPAFLVGGYIRTPCGPNLPGMWILPFRQSRCRWQR